MKPYYQEDGITIYHGDCLTILQEVSIVSTVCLTDPPYNVSQAYGDAYKDHYLDWPEWLGCRFDAVQTEELVYFPGHAALQACKQAGFQGIGIEIEERYCEIAAKRLSQGVLDLVG